MKILSTNINFTPNRQSFRAITNQNISFERKFDTFEISENKSIKFDLKKEEEFFDKFIHKSGKVTKKEYEDISKNHPWTLMKSEKILKKSLILTSTKPENAAKIAYNIKKHLDKNEKDYRIISIGTSPAIITEALSAMGCDVIFLPISGIRKDYCNYVERSSLLPLSALDKVAYPNIKKSLEYLAQKGIWGKPKKNTSKKILLMDYCVSSNTLYNVRDLICNFNKVPYKDIEPISLIKLIENLEIENLFDESNITQEEISNFREDLCASKLSKFCNVPHFHYNDELMLGQNCIQSKGKMNIFLFREFENFSRPLGRMYALCTLDEIKKIKQKKSDKKPD